MLTKLPFLSKNYENKINKKKMRIINNIIQNIKNLLLKFKNFMKTIYNKYFTSDTKHMSLIHIFIFCIIGSLVFFIDNSIEGNIFLKTEPLIDNNISDSNVNSNNSFVEVNSNENNDEVQSIPSLVDNIETKVNSSLSPLGSEDVILDTVNTKNYINELIQTDNIVNIDKSVQSNSIVYLDESVQSDNTTTTYLDEFIQANSAMLDESVQVNSSMSDKSVQVNNIEDSNTVNLENIIATKDGIKFEKVIFVVIEHPNGQGNTNFVLLDDFIVNENILPKTEIPQIKPGDIVKLYTVDNVNGVVLVDHYNAETFNSNEDPLSNSYDVVSATIVELGDELDGEIASDSSSDSGTIYESDHLGGEFTTDLGTKASELEKNIIDSPSSSSSDLETSGFKNGIDPVNIPLPEAVVGELDIDPVNVPLPEATDGELDELTAHSDSVDLHGKIDDKLDKKEVDPANIPLPNDIDDDL